MSRNPPAPPIPTDEDIARVVSALSRRMYREVFEIAQRASLAAEACIRFAPVAIYCKHAREARGEEIKSAAKALKVPQYALRAIEDCDVLDLEFSMVARYASHLGIEPWFQHWADSNERMVAILVQPRALRESLRSWSLTDFEDALPKAASTEPPEMSSSPEVRRPAQHDPVPVSARALQLEIVLEGIAPPVWRRILISSDVTLHALHRAVQSAMGWEGTHLYQFEVGGDIFSDPSDWDDRPPGLGDCRKVHLCDLALPAGASFQYRYDFGDDWCHRISVERVGAASSRRRLPVCLAGERACPPEDSGGAPGYEGMLRALRDPRHPERREIQEWMPGGFDPEAFDLVEANRRLQSSGAARRRMSPSAT